MRILILGGTGPIGKHLVNILNDLKYKVVVTSRQSNISYDNVKYVKCNALKITELSMVLKERWDVIVDFMVYHNAYSFERRRELLLNSTSHYMFLSSARVYADSAGCITEKTARLYDVSTDYDYLETQEYALLKACQENLLINSKKSNWTILRPYITFSDYRLQLGTFEKENWLYRALQGREIVFDRNMLNKTTTMTYGLDVAQKIAGLIGVQESMGEIYQIATLEHKTWLEIAEIYFDIIEENFGFRPKIFTVDSIVSSLDIRASRYQVIYDRMYNRKFDSGKINTVLNDSSYTDVKEALNICLTNFIRNPEFQYINWKFEAVKDKITGDKTLDKEIRSAENYRIYTEYRY